MADVEEGFSITRDGRRLHVLDYSGPPHRTPVVCIPGLRSNLHGFDFIAPHIAQTRRVLCIGMRGRGRSDYESDSGIYGLRSETTDVLWVSRQARIKRAVLLGASRGGFVALVLAARTDLVAGIIFSDSGPQMEVGGMSRYIPDLAADVSYPSWDALVAALKPKHIAWFPDMPDKDWHALARQLYREEGGRIVADSDSRIQDSVPVRSTDHPSGGSWAGWSAFESIPHLPMIALRGEHSDFVSERTVKRMKAMRPDLVAVTIKGRGHPPLMDEPDFVAAIDSFLEGIP